MDTSNVITSLAFRRRRLQLRLVATDLWSISALALHCTALPVFDLSIYLWCFMHYEDMRYSRSLQLHHLLYCLLGPRRRTHCAMDVIKQLLSDEEPISITWSRSSYRYDQRKKMDKAPRLRAEGLLLLQAGLPYTVQGRAAWSCRSLIIRDLRLCDMKRYEIWYPST